MNFNMNTKMKFISSLLVVVVSAIGFVFLLASKNTQVKSPSPSVTPAIEEKPEGRFWLELTNPETKLAEPINLIVRGDSNKNSITGFDLILSFDQKQMKFVSQKNLNEEFEVFRTVKDDVVNITAIKKLNSNTSTVFDKTPLIELTFQPIKSGKSDFRFEFTPQSKTDSNMINDKSEEILEKVSGLKVEVN